MHRVLRHSGKLSLHTTHHSHSLPLTPFKGIFYLLRPFISKTGMNLASWRTCLAQVLNVPKHLTFWHPAPQVTSSWCSGICLTVTLHIGILSSGTAVVQTLAVVQEPLSSRFCQPVGMHTHLTPVFSGIQPLGLYTCEAQQGVPYWSSCTGLWIGL